MIVAVDANSRDTAEAEHVLHELLSATAAVRTSPVVTCTHVVPGGDRPHHAVSITTAADLSAPVRAWCAQHAAGLAVTSPDATAPELSGPSALVRGAYLAAVEAGLRTAGRLVDWPGREHATGILTATDLRTRCGIDDLEVLGATPLEPHTRVDTRDFVRPVRRAGRTVLQLQPAAGNLLIPFELQHQQQCCTDH